jgi:L-ribulokinase
VAPRGRETARAFTVGADFGTNSVRAIVADCADGRVVGTAVADYASGERGVLLEPRQPHLARQNPADYLDGLRAAVRGALAVAEREDGFARDRVIGIGTDTTGSTPLPVDAACRPLALDPAWRGNLAAHAWLWKDHTGAAEAEAITETAARHAPQYLAPIGGRYSSEWFWSKIWRCLKVAPDVFDAAASWVELADYVPAALSGVTSPMAIRRCICAAGHKAMYLQAWGGLPAAAFLARLDPRLAALRERLYVKAYPADGPAGRLCDDWATALGLPAGIPVAMGGFDAHYGAVGAGVRSGTLVKIIGTSTCDIAVAPADVKVADIPGICGIVPGSVMPGWYGIEAGQSAVGDLLEWWVGVVGASGGRGSEAGHERLTAEAAGLAAGASGLLGLDWNNGNRTILVDQRLTGLLVGQTLHTTPAEVYRTLIEATAFGARAIVDRMSEYRVPIERVVCCGGIAEKNALFMQIYADVLGRPMLIAGSPQTPALGAAIAAAVAAGSRAGGHAGFEAAQERMTSLQERRFVPDAAAQRVYDELYGLYRRLHDAFGGVRGAGGGRAEDLGAVMKRLLEIRERVTGQAGEGAGCGVDLAGTPGGTA